MSNDTQHYIVAIEDLFRVPAGKVSSEEEAEQYVLEHLGTGPFVASDAQVVDSE